MKAIHRKRSHERVVKTSISLPTKLYEFGEERVRLEGHTGLSGYLQSLLRYRMTTEPLDPHGRVLAKG